MHICLIGSAENDIDIFPELAKLLSKKISGLELEERFVPSAMDLPIVAREVSEESDFIFVFAQLEEEEALLIKQKLIDVELATKTRILKAVDSDSLLANDEEDLEEQKIVFAEKFAALIVNILFNEDSFKPKAKDLFE